MKGLFAELLDAAIAYFEAVDEGNDMDAEVEAEAWLRTVIAKAKGEV